MRRNCTVVALHVDQSELDAGEESDKDHGCVQSILEHLETVAGLLLAAARLSEALLAVRVVLALLVELDGPALEVSVKLEHDQGEAESRGDQQARDKEIDHE